MGGRKPQAPKKKKRHECDAAFPEAVRAAGDEILARGGEDDASRTVVEGVRKLLASKKLEEQTRTVHSWGAVMFGDGGIEGSGRYAAPDSVWHSILRFLLGTLFHYSIAHVQKAVVGIFSTGAASAPKAVAYAVETVFPELCSAWLTGHWEALRAAEALEGNTSAAVDSRAARARCALKIVCDVDCLLDHAKPVFHSGIVNKFPPILALQTRCTNLAAKECMGAALLEGDSAGGETTGNNAQGAAMEDLKYFTRINLYLLQKLKSATRALVSATQADAQAGDGVRELAKLCQQILTHEGLFPKECLNTAGLMIAILLEAAAPALDDATPPAALAASPHHQWLRDALQLPAGACQKGGDVRAIARAGAAVPGIKHEQLFNALAAQDSGMFRALLHSWAPYSQLLALRGVVHCCGEAVYLARDAAGRAMLPADFLPFATAFAANPDANMRFLALQSIELAVQKIRNCLNTQVASIMRRHEEAGAAVPIPAADYLVTYDRALGELLENVLDVLWSVWDEPAAAIGHLLTSIFQLVLEIHRRGAEVHEAAQWPLEASQQIDLETITRRLVAGPWLRRGKYPSLALMLPVVGAEKLRSQCPDIIPQTLAVLHVKGLAHGAGALFASYATALKPLLRQGEWDDEVLRPVAEALLFAGWDGTGATGTRATAEATADTHSGLLRHHLTNYALNPLMQNDASVAPRVLAMLTATALPHLPENPFHAGAPPAKKRCVSETAPALRKVLPTLVARRLVASHVLITKLAKLPPAEQPVVRGALESHAPSVRIMSAKLLTLGSHRPSDLLSMEEAELLKAFTKRNLKTDDSAFRSHHSDLMRKIIVRCKEAIHKYAKDLAGGDPTAAPKQSKKAKKEAKKATQAQQTEVVGTKRKGSPSEAPSPVPVPVPEDTVPVAADLAARHTVTVEYLEWLGRYLVRSAYSTSPLERRCVALELLAHLAGLFAPEANQAAPEAARRVYAAAYAAALPAAFVPVLMGSLCESWDKVRMATWNVLRLYPAPLPGYADKASVERLAARAAVDLQSPKIKDADSGALVWRLLHRKYAVELGWRFGFTAAGDALVTTADASPGLTAGWEAHRVALVTLLARLEAIIDSRRPGEFNPVHGVMAAIGNVLEDCRLAGLVERDQLGNGTLAAGVDGAAWKELLSAIVEKVCAVCRHAMRNVAGATTGEIDDFTPAGVDCRGHAFFADRNDEKSDRLVVVNSWLAVKEGCNLVAALITSAPLAAPGAACEVLPVDVIRHAGDVVIDVALRGKHNGVIAKASDALRTICHRTIRCRLAALHTLAAAWLEGLLGSGGVTSTNAARILRRSAGLPHVLTSILDAEDHTAGPPALAHSVIATLLEIIERPEDATAADAASPCDEDGDEITPPAYLAKVNALNVLKYVVDDTFLRDVVLCYAGRSLALTLVGFSHEVWAVRNSSLMLFSSLITRLVGSASGAGATSFKDFVARYSTVLPTLLEHLRKASCDDKSGTGLHPALSPLLLLFSFLLPSGDAELAAAQGRYFVRGAALPWGDGLVDAAAEDAPLEILGLLDACHALKNCVGRTLSIRAFVPLIAPSARLDAIRYILSRLPMPGAAVRNNAFHGRLLQLQGLMAGGTEGADVAAEAAAVRAGLKGVLGSAPHSRAIAPANLSLLFTLAAELVRGATGDAGFASACRDAAWGVIAPLGGQAPPGGPVHGVVAGEETFIRAVVLYLTACCALKALADAETCVLQGVFTHDAVASVATTDVCSALEAHPALLDRPGVHRGLLASVHRAVEALLATPTHGSHIRFSANLRAMLAAAAASCQRQNASALVALFAADPALAGLPGLLTQARKVVRNHHVASALLLFRATLASAQLAAAGACDAGALEALCSELAETCSPHEAVEVRYGCVEALRLLNLPAMYTSYVKAPEGKAAIPGFLVRLWRVACVLINDEHDGVREAMAAAVQDVPAADHAGDAVAARLAAVPGVAHAERACEMCFRWITAAAALSPEGMAEGLAHLASIVLHPVTPGQSAVYCEGFVVDSVTPPALPFAPQDVAGRSQVIFEVENQNHYSEDVLTVTLAASQLRMLLATAQRLPETAAVADAFLDRLARRVGVEAAAVGAVVKESDESRALAFSSVFRLTLAALLCGDRAHGALALIPPHYSDELWLSQATTGATATMTDAQWGDILFLHQSH
eukprot:TRINITY_DN22127_c0_g1_i1.p1 TRINITY_DN22127_c0_g1~~TRINITY_DN22127_c0_g1_i1.p1  ORF type:complete len:2172 (+),score=599.11 TRINITY_DN22127_c0_g1_i1:76-6591(+)